MKDKLSSYKSHIANLAQEQETLHQERAQLREQVDQLALQSATAEERVRAEANEKRTLEAALQKAKEQDAAKSKQLKSAMEKLHARESDLAKLEDAARTSKTQSSDRVVLELEIDRLKRDLKRTERDADEALEKANAASMKLADLVRVTSMDVG
jgi:chromosome segregation ATPase